jgi:hypothetical protein
VRGICSASEFLGAGSGSVLIIAALRRAARNTNEKGSPPRARLRGATRIAAARVAPLVGASPRCVDRDDPRFGLNGIEATRQIRGVSDVPVKETLDRRLFPLALSLLVPVALSLSKGAIHQ